MFNDVHRSIIAGSEEEVLTSDIKKLLEAEGPEKVERRNSDQGKSVASDPEKLERQNFGQGKLDPKDLEKAEHDAFYRARVAKDLNCFTEKPCRKINLECAEDKLRVALAFAVSTPDVRRLARTGEASLEYICRLADELVGALALAGKLLKFNDAAEQVAGPISIGPAGMRLDRSGPLPTFGDLVLALHELEPASLKNAAVVWAEPIWEVLASITRKRENRTWLEYVRAELLPRKVKLHEKAIIPSTYRLEVREQTEFNIPVEAIPKPVQSHQKELKLFGPPQDSKTLCVPILEVFDLAGKPLVNRHQSAPLAMRCLHLPMFRTQVKDRKLSVSITFEIPAKELMDMLWPGGWKKGRDWKKLKKALNALHHMGFRLPSGIFHRPSLIRSYPFTLAGKLDLSLPIKFEVEIPSGMADGPSIPLEPLCHLGSRKGRAYNAAIAGRSLLYKPGKTWVRNSKNKKRWSWSRKIERYPILLPKDRRHLVFGYNSGHRTWTEVDKAWETAVDSRIGLAFYRTGEFKNGFKGERLVPAEILPSY